MGADSWLKRASGLLVPRLGFAASDQPYPCDDCCEEGLCETWCTNDDFPPEVTIDLPEDLLPWVDLRCQKCTQVDGGEYTLTDDPFCDGRYKLGHVGRAYVAEDWCTDYMTGLIDWNLILSMTLQCDDVPDPSEWWFNATLLLSDHCDYCDSHDNGCDGRICFVYWTGSKFTTPKACPPAGDYTLTGGNTNCLGTTQTGPCDDTAADVDDIILTVPAV